MTPEPAQPAESPEARALTILDVPPVSPPPNSNGILCFACGKRVEHTSAGYCFSCIATFNVPDAATTARPTERGAVEESPLHWRNRIADASHRLRRLETGHVLSTVYDGKTAALRSYQVRADIGVLLAALTPPVTVAATDQAGEVEGWIVGNNVGQWRTFDSFGWAWTARRDLAVRYARRQDAEMVHGEDEDSWRVEQYPALDTQTATGRTMGGEVERGRLAGLEEAALIAQTFGVPGGHVADTAREVANAIRRRVVLASPQSGAK